MKRVGDILQEDDVLRARYYDRQGRPMRFLDWGALFENLDYKRVARTRLWHGAQVSTVWLGLDHSFVGGPPLIFESMVFAPMLNDIVCVRYATEEEAREGHARLVRAWRWRPFPVWAAMLRHYTKRLRARLP